MKSFAAASLHLLYSDLRRCKIALLLIFLYLIAGMYLFHSICPFVICFHFPCPGCGLTRAGLCVLRGKFDTAWHYNPSIYLWMPLIAFFILKRYLLHQKIKHALLYASFTAVVTLIVYLYRLFTHSLSFL